MMMMIMMFMVVMMMMLVWANNDMMMVGRVEIAKMMAMIVCPCILTNNSNNPKKLKIFLNN